MVQALLRATDAQKEIIAQNYAKHDDVAVQRIKQLYSDLNIKQVFPSCLHSFLPSLLHSFIPSFLHSFIPSFLRTDFVHVYPTIRILPTLLSSLVISPVSINTGV